MPQEMSIKKVYQAVHHGYERLRNFRASRLMFLRAYAGQYYDRDHGTVGNEPINMIFNAISILVPNLVSNFPKNLVRSRFLMYRDYGELLSLGLDYLGRDINIKNTFRRWIVDSIFTMGIIKTGLATSKDLVMFSDNERIDNGQPYAELVDFDDFVIDPSCRHLGEAAFIGNKMRVPRQMLLDSGLYKNHIVEKLPQAGSDPYSRDPALMISQHELTPLKISEFQDDVEVVELWVPGANATITIPAGTQTYDEYLRIEDYNGSDDGPYTYLMLTNPPSDNPLPVSPVSVWHDLHIMGNKMMKKIMDQAERQKTILGYKRTSVDDAQDVVDASDGEAVGMDDPQAVQTFKFGGQEQSNEAHLAQLSYWFSMMSGNTDQLGGLRTGADTATGQQILQANGNVRMEDMRDIVYEAGAQVNRKLAWYLHTDPLISLPMIRRRPVPAQVEMTPNGPILIPQHVSEEQVILSPDTRRGDFLDFHFSIEAKSMSRMDPAMRLQRALTLGTQVLPAAATAGQVCQQMGIPFSVSRYIINMAKEMDIEWMDEVFFDPTFQQNTMSVAAAAPRPDTPKAQETIAGVMQNQGSSNIGAVQSPGAEANATSQETAGMAQAGGKMGGGMGSSGI